MNTYLIKVTLSYEIEVESKSEGDATQLAIEEAIQNNDFNTEILKIIPPEDNEFHS